MEGDQEIQRPVTAIPRWVAYSTAVAVPAVSVLIVAVLGRRGAEFTLLSVALFVALTGSVALVA